MTLFTWGKLQRNSIRNKKNKDGYGSYEGEALKKFMNWWQKFKIEKKKTKIFLPKKEREREWEIIIDYVTNKIKLEVTSLYDIPSNKGDL